MENKKEDWLEKKCGSFSASNIDCLFSDPKSIKDKELGLLSDTAMTYIKSKAAELLTGIYPETFTTKEMQWGLDNEPYAVEILIEKYRCVTYYGNDNPTFFPLTNFSGASPDGLYHSVIFDVKCPNSSTHIDYLLMSKKSDPSAALKAYEKKYWHQLQMGAVTLNRNGFDISHCSLVSYDPRFRKEFQIAEITFPIDPLYEDELMKRIFKAESELRNILTTIGV
jgi:hypothetical protein